MNREIKFRGKRIDTGEWVYGSLLQWKDGDAIICANESLYSNVLIKRDVNPDTVGQYTGLTDRNGKEIYEGDIIGGSNGSINGYEWPFKLLIKWNNERCGFNTPAWGYMDSTHYYDVIGNIHDNPELLEDGK